MNFRIWCIDSELGFEGWWNNIDFSTKEEAEFHITSYYGDSSSAAKYEARPYMGH